MLLIKNNSTLVKHYIPILDFFQSGFVLSNNAFCFAVEIESENINLDENKYQRAYQQKLHSFSATALDSFFLSSLVIKSPVKFNSFSTNNKYINQINKIRAEKTFKTHTTKSFFIFESKKLFTRESEAENIYYDFYRKAQNFLDKYSSSFKVKYLSLADQFSVFNYLTTGEYKKFNFNKKLIVDLQSYFVGEVFFDSRLLNCQNYFVINGRYSCFLSILIFPNSVDKNFWTTYFRNDIEFNLFQRFQTLSSVNEKDKLERKIRRQSQARFTSAEDADELAEIIGYIEKGEIDIFYHSCNIQIFADDLEQLDEKVSFFQKNPLFTLKREIINTPNIYFSRLPTYQTLNPRKIKIANLQAAALLHVESSISGSSSSIYDLNNPIDRFKTIDYGIHNFSFNGSNEGSPPNSNTIIFGGTGSGKTTLISYLLAQCLRNPKTKAICFDQYNGMKIFNEFMGGDYLNFGKSIKFNPFSIDLKDHLNQQFLLEFTKILINTKIDDKTYDGSILDIIKKMSQLGKGSINLTKFAALIEAMLDESQINHLKSWINKNIFSDKKDAFNFDKQLVSFDFHSVFMANNNKLVEIISYYLFFRIFEYFNREDKEVEPYLIFVDEITNYIENDNFALKLKSELEQIRKRYGTLIFATQSPKNLLNNETGKKMVANFETVLIFPQNSKDDIDALVDSFNLTQYQRNWLSSAPTHQLLLINSVGSEILDVNLKDVGKYLKIFSSSIDDVRKLNNFKRNDPKNYLDLYLEK